MAMSGNQKLLRDCIVEGIGAFFLMSLKFGVKIPMLGEVSLQDSIFEYALVIGLLIWVGQAISGAYYFSSITIMSMFNKSLEVKKGLWYLLAQAIGVLLASLYYFYSYVDNKSRKRNKPYPFTTQYINPQGKFLIRFIFLEFTSTLFFAMFVAAFKTYKQCPDAMVAPLVGLSYAAFSNAISKATGGFLDFFFYIFPALIWGKINSFVIVFAVGPPLGAICGYFLFNLIFTSPKGQSSD